MPESRIVDLSHSPPRNVVDKYPQDEWNRLLRRVYVGIYKHFHDAGVDDPVRQPPHLTLDRVHEICTRLERYLYRVGPLSADSSIGGSMCGDPRSRCSSDHITTRAPRHILRLL